jgi:hypothetical protein
MFDHHFFFAKEVHNHLMDTARRARLAGKIRSHLPTLRDYLYLQLGDSLIALGQRLRDESAFAQTPTELGQECA